MTLIDTHTHIYLPEFDSDRDEAIKRAIANGVERMLMPNIDPESTVAMLETENSYKGICTAMMGLHPTSVKDSYRDLLQKTVEEINRREYIAIGEIGIDLYWDKTHIREQIEVFRTQLEIAADLSKPVVIHSRDSFREIFEVLEYFGKGRICGVFHAFTGDSETAAKVTGLGFKLGIGGIVTFKNSGLSEAIASCCPDDIILETDSPYLAPVPHRGKRNESSYLPLINSKIASIFGLNPDKSAEITSKNARELFRLN
jgi:TatD DNase family protein